MPHPPPRRNEKLPMQLIDGPQRPALHSRPLPVWLAADLSNPPTAGTGVHKWLYRMACALVPWRSTDESFQILSAAAQGCSRRVTHHELVDAVQNAENDWLPDGLSRGLRMMKPRLIEKTVGIHHLPRPDWSLIEAVARSGARLVDLWEASPYRLNGGIPSKVFLRHLFPKSELLCCARSGPWDAETRAVKEWESIKGWPAEFSFVVPSPMTALAGRRKIDGKPGARTEDNTGARRWLVVEFDFAMAKDGEKPGPCDDILNRLAAETKPRTAPDLCGALLLHLAREERAPLALAVHSGGKSVHGWFPVAGASDEILKPFFSRCCLLGADTATWSKVQLVRLPGGARPDGRKQPVHYFNPALCPAA